MKSLPVVHFDKLVAGHIQAISQLPCGLQGLLEVVHQLAWRAPRGALLGLFLVLVLLVTHQVSFQEDAVEKGELEVTMPLVLRVLKPLESQSNASASFDFCGKKSNNPSLHQKQNRRNTADYVEQPRGQHSAEILEVTTGYACLGCNASYSAMAHQVHKRGAPTDWLGVRTQ